MRKIAFLLSVVAAPVAAQDEFSDGSTAKEWGLYAEYPAFFAAEVVDPLCVLTGDCPDNCGDGRRQLALMRKADGAMVLAVKNNQPAFTGAANELLPFCGQAVEVDGLMLDDPDLGAANVYLVQKIRAEGASDWITANKWTKDWAAAHPEAAGEGPWFRRDPRVKAEVEREGWLGLGLEQDREFLAEWLK